MSYFPYSLYAQILPPLKVDSAEPSVSSVSVRLPK